MVVMGREYRMGRKYEMDREYRMDREYGWLVSSHFEIGHLSPKASFAHVIAMVTVEYDRRRRHELPRGAYRYAAWIAITAITAGEMDTPCTRGLWQRLWLRWA